LSSKVQVKIFGSPYALHGDGEPEYVQALASYVDQKMGALSDQAKGISLSRLAVLTAINISHELFQLKNQQKEQRSFVDGKTRDIIERIEEQFDDLQMD